MSDKKFDLSRRNVLAGLGTIGLASAGAGIGTTAYFNDTESFTDNTLTAGELNLVVDYYTTVDQGSATGTTESTTGSGTVDGANEYAYDINDVKPGDSGCLVFCPKIVDNPAYLWVASTGVTDYENGSPEPELEVDETNGDPGEGEGELSEYIQVDVGYGSVDTSDGFSCSVDRYMNNPEDYTLADLAADIEFGFPIEAGVETPVYPASPDTETQTGPCLVVEWEVPTSVGNIIQTDGLSMDFTFAAEQARHNENPASPFAVGDGYSSISYEKALSSSIYAHAGSGGAEAELHHATNNDQVMPFGSNDFPSGEDVDFAVELDVDAKTVTLSVDAAAAGGSDVSVSDTDVTDGFGNSGTQTLVDDSEWTGGIPSTVDIAINAKSQGGNSTVTKNLTLNGNPVAPSQLTGSGGNVYVALPGVDASAGSVITVAGTVQFNGGSFSGQDAVGIDFR